MDFVKLVKSKVATLLNSDTQSVAHRLDHIERVLKHAEAIACQYPEVDMEVLRLSILLHDIDEPYNKKSNHVALSMRKAESVLSKIGYPKSGIEKVITIISEHSTEHIDEVKPSSLEARILFDADKLDGVGASGIARVFSLFGQSGKTPLEAIAWYRMKIEKSLSNMQTEEGKQLFVERLEYVEQFLNKVEEENIEILSYE